MRNLSTALSVVVIVISVLLGSLIHAQDVAGSAKGAGGGSPFKPIYVPQQRQDISLPCSTQKTLVSIRYWIEPEDFTVRARFSASCEEANCEIALTVGYEDAFLTIPRSSSLEYYDLSVPVPYRGNAVPLWITVISTNREGCYKGSPQAGDAFRIQDLNLSVGP